MDTLLFESMQIRSNLKTLLVIVVAFSLASLPAVPRGHADYDPTAGAWYPAGPQMQTLSISEFTTQPAEYTALSGSQIDLMDAPLTPAQNAAICPSPGFLCTTPDAIGNQYGRLSNWALGGTSPGISSAIAPGYAGLPNYFNWLNAYSATPASPGTIRQGFSTSVDSLNPFVASSTQDLYVLKGMVYDTLFRANPLCNPAGGSGVPACSSPVQALDWMTIYHAVLSPTPSNLGYNPPAGTAADLRITLNHNMHWQDSGMPVTAWDVKWTYNNLVAAGAAQSALLSSLIGVQVLSPYQIDLNLNAVPGDLALGSVTIMPGHLWSACGATNWNSNISPTAALGSGLSVDPLLSYVDSDSNTHWDPGETVVYDSDRSLTYTANDVVISGATPALGTALSNDGLIKFVNPYSQPAWFDNPVIYDVNTDNIYDSGDTLISGWIGGGSNIGGASIVSRPEDLCVGTTSGDCTAFSNGVCTGSTDPCPSSSILNAAHTPVGCVGTSGGLSYAAPAFDPVANGLLVGSGPWTCESIGGTGHPAVGTIGGGCSSDNTQAPPVGLAFTLTRTGCVIMATGLVCVAPTSRSTFNGITFFDYFRSSGFLALYTWTGDDGSGSHDFSTLLTVNNCRAAGNPNCPHWKQGIGNPGGIGNNAVGIAQLLEVNAFRSYSWIAYSTDTDTTHVVLTCGAGYSLPGTSLTPCNATNAGWQTPVMPGIGSWATTLYEVGSSLGGVSTNTLSPATPAGGPNGSYTNCAPPVGVAGGTAYPNGGYDC